MKLRELAIYFAGKLHKDQMYGESFYFYHLDRVDDILHSVGFKENSAERIAAYLHDVVEDCEVPIEDITKYFGEDISNIVGAVTNESGENRKEKALKTYPKIRRYQSALAVKLADRIANLEHSVWVSSKHANMYLNEDVIFVRELSGVWTDDPRICELWNKYNYLIEECKGKFGPPVCWFHGERCCNGVCY